MDWIDSNVNDENENEAHEVQYSHIRVSLLSLCIIGWNNLGKSNDVWYRLSISQFANVLTFLRYIIASNDLSGKIPSELGLLSSVERIYLCKYGTAVE